VKEGQRLLAHEDGNRDLVLFLGKGVRPLFTIGVPGIILQPRALRCILAIVSRLLKNPRTRAESRNRRSAA